MSTLHFTKSHIDKLLQKYVTVILFLPSNISCLDIYTVVELLVHFHLLELGNKVKIILYNRILRSKISIQTYINQMMCSKINIMIEQCKKMESCKRTLNYLQLKFVNTYIYRWLFAWISSHENFLVFSCDILKNCWIL